MTPNAPKSFEGKTCFVITPIGGEGTAIRREADGIVDEVLIPVLYGLLGFKVSVAHRIESTGSISQQVIRGVMEADLAVCNLTTLNPNVMYELALRHAARLPVVTIASDLTKLPFDIAEDRVIFYQNDIMGANILKDKLRPMVEACMKDDEPDNPVYRAITASKVIKEVHATGGSEAAIFDAISGLSKQINSIQNIGSRKEQFFMPNDPYYSLHATNDGMSKLTSIDTFNLTSEKTDADVQEELKTLRGIFFNILGENLVSISFIDVNATEDYVHFEVETEVNALPKAFKIAKIKLITSELNRHGFRLVSEDLTSG
jgi:hypothetical protein